MLPPSSALRDPKVTTVSGFGGWPARITNMKCGTHREGAPARYFLRIHSQTRLPPDTSSIFRPEEPKSDDSFRIWMTRSDSNMKCGTPREGAPA